MAELEKIVDLEIAVWGVDPRDAVPASILHAMVTNGSLVTGAYDGTSLIGMALAFPVPHNKQWMLWSHMAGTHPDYQSKGVGFAMKQFQRTWALERGYSKIGWTYDPLQRGNANFNLHQLGATANTYHEDFYGDMTDLINAGLPSDRLEVTWELKQSRVNQLAIGKQPRSQMLKEIESDHFLLRESENEHPILSIPPKLTSQVYLAQIPQNISAIKKVSTNRAFAWREALRTALQTAFSQGYSAQDFVALGNSYYYVLVAPQIWYLYVLECADQTLYTGITPNLEQRLSTHNKGRGAAYTAARRPVKMVAAWKLNTKQSAMRAERAFKKLSRSEKLLHITNKIPFADSPFQEIQL